MTTQRNNELIPKEYFDQLKALDAEMDKSIKNLENMLKPVQEISKEFTNSARTGKQLIDTINRFNQVQSQMNAAQNQHQRILQERDRLQQRLNMSNSQEVRDVIRLREELRRTTAQSRDSVRARNSEVGSIDQLNARLRQLRNEYRALSRADRNSQIGENLRRQIRAIREELSESGTGNPLTRLLGGNFRGNFLAMAAMKASEAISSVISSAKEFISVGVEMASKAEGVRTAFNKLDSPGLLKNLRAETKGLINDFDLMKSAVRAQNFGIPVENLGVLLKFAQQRAQETGESVDYLAESIINGIGRKSALILDNLGISSVRLQEKVKETGDFAKAAIQIVNEELEKQGDLALTSADKEVQATVKMQNAQMKFGEKLLFVKDIFSQLKEKSAEWLLSVADNYLPRAIKKIEDIINRLIDVYNTNENIRIGVNALIGVFKTLLDVVVYVVKTQARLLGGLFEGIQAGVNLDFDGVKKAFSDVKNSVVADSKELWKTIQENYNEAINVDVKIKPIDISSQRNAGNTIKYKSSPASENTQLQKSNSDESKKLAEKEAQAAGKLSEFLVEQTAKAQETIVKDEKTAYTERLNQLNDFVITQKELIELKKQNELNEAERTPSEIKLINLKANAELIKIDEEAQAARLDILKDYADEELKRISDASEAKAKTIDKIESKALTDLAELYSQGNMTAEQYEEGKTDIARKAAKDRFDAETTFLEEQLSILGLTEDQRQSIQKKIDDAALDYDKFINEERIKDFSKTADKLEEREKLMAEKRKEIVSELFNFISTLVSANAEKQLEKIDEESEKSNEYYDSETKKVERLEEAGAISKEQAEARKALIDERQKKREKQLEEQRAEIRAKQAEYEKKIAVMQILINTASTIMKNTAQLGFLAAIPVNVATLALSSAQIASVIAQNAPKYAKGGEHDKDGFAVVGDGGKHEMLIYPDGTIAKTPKQDTLLYLPKNTQIKPDFDKAILNMANMPVVEYNTRQKPIIIQDNERQIKLSEQNNRLIQILLSKHDSLSRTIEHVAEKNGTTKTGR